MGDQLSSPPTDHSSKISSSSICGSLRTTGIRSFVEVILLPKKNTSSGEVAVLICWFEVMNADLRFKQNKKKQTSPGEKFVYVHVRIILRIFIEFQYT